MDEETLPATPQPTSPEMGAAMLALSSGTEGDELTFLYRLIEERLEAGTFQLLWPDESEDMGFAYQYYRALLNGKGLDQGLFGVIVANVKRYYDGDYARLHREVMGGGLSDLPQRIAAGEGPKEVIALGEDPDSSGVLQMITKAWFRTICEDVRENYDRVLKHSQGKWENYYWAREQLQKALGHLDISLETFLDMHMARNPNHPLVAVETRFRAGIQRQRQADLNQKREALREKFGELKKYANGELMRPLDQGGGFYVHRCYSNLRDIKESLWILVGSDEKLYDEALKEFDGRNLQRRADERGACEAYLCAVADVRKLASLTTRGREGYWSALERDIQKIEETLKSSRTTETAMAERLKITPEELARGMAYLRSLPEKREVDPTLYENYKAFKDHPFVLRLSR